MTKADLILSMAEKYEQKLKSEAQASVMKAVKWVAPRATGVGTALMLGSWLIGGIREQFNSIDIVDLPKKFDALLENLQDVKEDSESGFGKYEKTFNDFISSLQFLKNNTSLAINVVNNDKTDDKAINIIRKFIESIYDFQSKSVTVPSLVKELQSWTSTPAELLHNVNLNLGIDLTDHQDIIRLNRQISEVLSKMIDPLTKILNEYDKQLQNIQNITTISNSEPSDLISLENLSNISI